MPVDQINHIYAKGNEIKNYLTYNISEAQAGDKAFIISETGATQRL